MDKKIIICRGIPGSGKSFWAKKFVEEDPENRVRFNNDDIRNMLGKYWVTSREPLVSCIKENFITRAMTLGYTIVIDNMNLNPKEVKYFEYAVKVHNSMNETFKYSIEFKDFWTPLDICIERDSKREHPIGNETIKGIYNKYKGFIHQQKVLEYKNSKAVQDNSLPNAIIVDIDSTLSLNVSGRPFYGPNSCDGMLLDEPIRESIYLVKSYLDYSNCKLIIVTGRNEGAREVTLKWLHDWYIEPDFLIMRENGDNTPTEVFKEKVYNEQIKDKFYIDMVLEDNNKCVAMWRRLGLYCLQPNDGTL